MDAYTTPEYFHCVTDSPFQANVYEPEADTFLFLEALDQQKSYLSGLTSGKEDCCIVEVGCGSGVVITHLFALLQSIDLLNTTGFGDSTHDAKRSSPVGVRHCGEEGSDRIPLNCGQFYAIDVNPLALQATALTWDKTLKKYFWDEIEKFMVQDRTAQGSSAAEIPMPSPNDVELWTYPAKSEGMSGGPLSTETVAADPRAEGEKSIKGSSCAFRKPRPYTLSLLEGDLLHALEDLQGPCRGASWDVVLFNPPYVPTSTEELEEALTRKDLITSAWCGGKRGRVVLDRFIEMLPHYLSRRGCCYIVLIKENDVLDVYRKIQAEFRRYLNATTRADGGSSAFGGQPNESHAYDGDPMQVICCAERYTDSHAKDSALIRQKLDQFHRQLPSRDTMEEIIVFEEPPHSVPAVVIEISDLRLTERFIRIANQMHPLYSSTQHLKRVRRTTEPRRESANVSSEDFSLGDDASKSANDIPCVERSAALELLLEGGESFRMRCEKYLPDRVVASLFYADTSDSHIGEQTAPLAGAEDALIGTFKVMYRSFLHALALEIGREAVMSLRFRVVPVASHGPSQLQEVWFRWNSVWPLSIPKPRRLEPPLPDLTQAANERMRTKVMPMCAALVEGNGKGQQPLLLGIAAAVYDPLSERWVADSMGCEGMRRDNYNACCAYVEASRCPSTSTGLVLEHPVICALKRASRAAAEAKNACQPSTQSNTEVRDECTSGEIEVRQFVPYLANNLDLYVSHEPCVMCAMALVHSRIARVFYCFPNKVNGGLGSVHAIHAIPSLNHHFRVYHCTKAAEEHKGMCCLL